jgi:hypothetical protein
MYHKSCTNVGHLKVYTTKQVPENASSTQKESMFFHCSTLVTRTINFFAADSCEIEHKDINVNVNFII